MICGRHVYGAGVMALGMVCLAWGGFDPGQPVAKDFPGRGAGRRLVELPRSSAITRSSSSFS
jgi:hypothetical protein